MAPFIGSFLGVLIRRLPVGRDAVFGRSHCESCGETLAAADMVPVLSHLLLRGRCRACGGPIATSHLVVELAAFGISVVAVAVEVEIGGDPARVWADCVLGWALLALGWIDIEHFILPDMLTLPTMLLGFVWQYWNAPDELTRYALAAVIGYALLRLVDGVYRLWRGRDGIGAGDAKLLAASGAWVGPEGLGPVILVAACIGLGAALIAHWRGLAITRTTRLPFGACLAAACWIVFLTL